MTWISGDAQNAERLSAASDCSVIVHAVNPPVSKLGTAGFAHAA
jgi:hypothetical protein